MLPGKLTCALEPVPSSRGLEPVLPFSGLSLLNLLQTVHLFYQVSGGDVFVLLFLFWLVDGHPRGYYICVGPCWDEGD